MKNILLLLSFLIIQLFGVNEKETKVLIIGDSISLGYTPFVKKSLVSDNVKVSHNEGNAQNSKYGLENIEEWISKDDYDIIQFNWGLWDLCYRNPESKVQGHRDKVNGELTATLEEYEENLEKIVKILKEKTNAKLIFVTTSYVPTNEAGRFTKDAQKYNKVAKRVMKRHSIPVNDIFSKSKTIHKEHGLGTDNVHYKEKGYEELGLVITSYLKKFL